MRILTPTNPLKEIKQLIKAGADELYCGVLSKEWKTGYTHVESINGMEFELSNIKSFEELKKAVRIAHSFDVQVFFTMHGLYTEEQYPSVVQEIKKAINMGADQLSIADTGLQGIGFCSRIMAANLNLMVSQKSNVHILKSEEIGYPLCR